MSFRVFGDIDFFSTSCYTVTKDVTSGDFMITITLFGKLSLTDGSHTVIPDPSAKRSYRALAYLILNRQKAIDCRDFHRFLHDGKDIPYDPSLVKVTLHRLRKELSLLSPDPITQKGGMITLFADQVLLTDLDFFDQAAKAFEESGELSAFFEAAAHYRGRVLFDLFGEGFTLPYVERYHRRWLSLLEKGLSCLASKGEQDAVISIADRAIAIDPFAEIPHYYRILVAKESYDLLLAAALFDAFCKRYQAAFHVSPPTRFLALGESL